jgi:hypothetical protein
MAPQKDNIGSFFIASPYAVTTPSGCGIGSQQFVPRKMK